MATAKKKSAVTAAREKAAVRAVEAGEGELYEVQWTLHHDGKEYGAGDPIALDAVAAEDLLAVGVIKPATQA